MGIASFISCGIHEWKGIAIIALGKRASLVNCAQLALLSVLPCIATAQTPSNFSFANPPTTNLIISSGGTAYSLTYVGPFNMPAYPGEPGFKPQAASGTESYNGNGKTTIRTVNFNSGVWSSQNLTGTLGRVLSTANFMVL